SGDMVSADVALPRREKDVALTAPGELTLGEGDAATTVAVAPAPPAGAFELILEATTTSDVLSGRWSQRVSAATGQVPGGGGRAGAFRLLYDGVGGAVMEGLEQWQRPVTKLVTALPLADQFLMALGEPDYPEPFDASGRLTKPI